MVIAHAGHWLPQLLYLVPLAVLVGAIVAGRVRDRRDARRRAHEPTDAPAGQPPDAPVRREG